MKAIRQCHRTRLCRNTSARPDGLCEGCRLHADRETVDDIETLIQLRQLQRADAERVGNSDLAKRCSEDERALRERLNELVERLAGTETPLAVA